MNRELAVVRSGETVTGALISDGLTTTYRKTEELEGELLLKEQELFPPLPALLTGGFPGLIPVTTPIFSEEQLPWMVNSPGRILASVGIAATRRDANAPKWQFRIAFWSIHEESVVLLKEILSPTFESITSEGTFLTLTLPIDGGQLQTMRPILDTEGSISIRYDCTGFKTMDIRMIPLMGPLYHEAGRQIQKFLE